MQRVFEPTVSEQVPVVAVAPRLGGLRGKRIGFVDNSKCNADLFIRRLCSQFGDRYAVVPGPIVRKLAPKDRLSEADLSRLAQCDAVILCFGDCGTSTSITVADANLNDTTSNPAAYSLAVDCLANEGSAGYVTRPRGDWSLPGSCERIELRGPRRNPQGDVHRGGQSKQKSELPPGAGSAPKP